MAHGSHGHTHGVIDPSIATTDRGIRAIKWSFVILALTAALQLVVVYFSGSVALFADTIHIVETIKASGVTSLAGIARALNARGMRSARGARWHVSTVANLLARSLS